MRPQTRAAAVIEQGTRADAARRDRHARGPGSEGTRSADIESPALLIVGEVTRLHETLQWFNSTADASEVRIAGIEGRLSA